MGNLNSTFSVIGASNHSKCERQAEDYYATESKAVDLLVGVEKFSNNIWECAGYAYDFNEYLMEMYKGVQSGYELPTIITEE